MPWLFRTMVNCSRAASAAKPRDSGAQLRLGKRIRSRKARRRNKLATSTGRSLRSELTLGPAGSPLYPEGIIILQPRVARQRYPGTPRPADSPTLKGVGSAVAFSSPDIPLAE